MPPKIIYAGIAVAMVLVIGFIVYSERPPAPPPIDAIWEAELQAKSAEINKNLPSPVDEETLLVSTTAKGNTLEFRHTFVNLQKEDVDVDQTSSALYGTLRSGACSSVEMKLYRDHSTTLQYVYYDKDGDYVLGIKVETKNCS